MAKDAKKTKNEKPRKEKSFFKELRAELKKVVWPSPKQLVNKTSIVLGMILITAAIVFCLDLAFDKGYQFVIDKSEAVIEKIENSKTENKTSEESKQDSEKAESDTNESTTNEVNE